MLNEKIQNHQSKINYFQQSIEHVNNNNQCQKAKYKYIYIMKRLHKPLENDFRLDMNGLGQESLLP